MYIVHLILVLLFKNYFLTHLSFAKYFMEYNIYTYIQIMDIQYDTMDI